MIYEDATEQAFVVPVPHRRLRQSQERIPTSGRVSNRMNIEVRLPVPEPDPHAHTGRQAEKGAASRGCFVRHGRLRDMMGMRSVSADQAACLPCRERLRRVGGYGGMAGDSQTKPAAGYGGVRLVGGAALRG
jgi:hypothetical protein